MNELDLMDSSKNDYQLVTELSKIVRSYKNKNKPVDRNFVDSVLLSCIKNDVVDVKNGIKSSDDNDVFGYFDIDSIFINYSLFDGYFKDLKEADRFNNLGDHNMLYYHLMISTIIHEYTHAKQYYLSCNRLDCIFPKIYNFCFNVSVTNPSFYQFYYDFFPIERSANIRSYYLCYHIFERVYGNKSPMLFRILFMNYLLKEYDVDFSPLGEFNNICNQYGYGELNALMPNYEMLKDNLWDRVIAGVSVMPDEYAYLRKIHFDMINDDDAVNWSKMKNSSIKKMIMDYNKK